MDSVIDQLAEIESTAEAIVDHAEQEKREIEKRIQMERNQFDQDLETKTQERLAAIRAEAQDKTDRILNEQRQKNHSMLDNLQKEYEENHEAYAREIVKHIIEV